MAPGAEPHGLRGADPGARDGRRPIIDKPFPVTFALAASIAVDRPCAEHRLEPIGTPIMIAQMVGGGASIAHVKSVGCRYAPPLVKFRTMFDEEANAIPARRHLSTSHRWTVLAGAGATSQSARSSRRGGSGSAA